MEKTAARKAGVPGPPARAGCQGAAVRGETFPRSSVCAQSWGLGRDGGEGARRGLQPVAWERRARVALLQWYQSRDGGIAGALRGFGGMCLRGPARGANATGRCSKLDAWSDRWENTRADTWTISRPSNSAKPGKLGSQWAGRGAPLHLQPPTPAGPD